MQAYFCKRCGKTDTNRDNFVRKHGFTDEVMKICKECKYKEDKIRKERTRNNRELNLVNHYEDLVKIYQKYVSSTSNTKIKVITYLLRNKIYCDICGNLLEEVKLLMTKKKNGEEFNRLCCSTCKNDFLNKLKNAYKWVEEKESQNINN